MSFSVVYLPIGVGTFHLESAQAQFDHSCALLRGLEPDVVYPDEMLLSVDALRSFLADKTADLAIVQNLTFANAAASLITTRKGALAVMPDRAEVEEFLKSRR